MTKKMVFVEVLWRGADSGEEFAVPICSSLLVVREGCGNGGCCFRRVAVVASEEMAAAAAMVGGREIRVRVSCVRWRR